MPKDTFFKLPEDKRSFICEVAFDEFAEYPFDQASINRIVAGSGIAKGSFYQYFEDKKDLFLYLMGLIAEEKVNYLSPVIRYPEKYSFFRLIRELFVAGIQFAIEHPRYQAIGNKLLANKDATILNELKVANLPASDAFIEPLVEKAIARGEIKPGIDVKMFSRIISSMNVAIVEYCSETYSEAIYDSMIETVDSFIDILQNGTRGDSEKILDGPFVA